MKTIREILWSKLGHCMRCMRLTFHVAAAISIILVANVYFLEWSWVTTVISIAAACAITLWFLHIFAFATKASSYRPDIDRRSGHYLSRRQLTRLFGQFLIVAAVASATPASAQTCSDGRSPCFSGTCCGSGQKCCCDYPTSKYCETNGTPCTC